MTKMKTIDNYYAPIGGFDAMPPSERKYTVVQSFWTKPILQSDNSLSHRRRRMRETLMIAALSLAYAHRSGYKVNMHTDSFGYELLKDFGYDRLLKTLDTIPDSVPKELFAAGKYFAMKKEGKTGKVHIDTDVFLKRAGVIDKFYTDKSVDVIVQGEEDYDGCICAQLAIPHMEAIGYPPKTNPRWRASWNTGVIGFNNVGLAATYINNYFKALDMYTEDVFEAYKREHQSHFLNFDFILEQVNIAWLGKACRPYMLVPMANPTEEADRIGYQHLQGGSKWTASSQTMVTAILKAIDYQLFTAAFKAGNLVNRMMKA